MDHTGRMNRSNFHPEHRIEDTVSFWMMIMLSYLAAIQMSTNAMAMIHSTVMQTDDICVVVQQG